MSQKNLHRTSLVIVELGAVWPAALIAADAAPCRVLAEAEGEGPLAFAARVEHFADSAFPRGSAVSQAFVACNQRADETAEAARRAMVGCLLAQVAPGGSIVLTAAEDASDRFRRRLLDLAADLGRAAGDRRLRAQFVEESSPTASGLANSTAPTATSDAVARVA
jgi:hypothetical protein